MNKLFGLCLLIILSISIAPRSAMGQHRVHVSFQTFYDELQPYGTWIDDPDYGNVWVPDADADFKPYGSRGHWIETSYGNTWVSDYPWGWAAFHYGRWRYDDYYGWEWIPGSDWGPAWVNWRTGGGYYAWAPLAPGISISISFGGRYRVPNDYWVCVPREHICDPYVNRYYVPHERVVNVINQTTIINNTYINHQRTYVSGPRPHEIEQYTHTRVPVYTINNTSSPRTAGVHNNAVNLYRPSVMKSNNGNGARPATVVSATAYRNANPNAGIASREHGAAINQQNASRLKQVAHSTTPDNNIVHVNKPLNTGGNNRPVQGAAPIKAGQNPSQSNFNSGQPAPIKPAAQNHLNPQQHNQASPQVDSRHNTTQQIPLRPSQAPVPQKQQQAPSQQNQQATQQHPLQQQRQKTADQQHQAQQKQQRQQPQPQRQQPQQQQPAQQQPQRQQPQQQQPAQQQPQRQQQQPQRQQPQPQRQQPQQQQPAQQQPQRQQQQPQRQQPQQQQPTQPQQQQPAQQQPQRQQQQPQPQRQQQQPQPQRQQPQQQQPAQQQPQRQQQQPQRQRQQPQQQQPAQQQPQRQQQQPQRQQPQPQRQQPQPQRQQPHEQKPERQNNR